MNPEQQRIAIAEACGLKLFPMGPSDKQWLKTKEDGGVEQVPLPDYLNDLNAMHEAEKTLQHYGHFVDILAKVMGEPKQGIMLPLATAAQRAEAFLKTMGRWEGEQP